MSDGLSAHDGGLEVLIASVAVSASLYSFDSLYDYIVPAEFQDEIRLGMRIIVPFGRANKKVQAIVFGLRSGIIDSPQCKRIAALADDGIFLSDEAMTLAKWLKENTFCTYFDAVRAMLPSGLGIVSQENFSLVKNPPATELTEFEQNLYNSLSNIKTRRLLNEALSSNGNPDKKLAVQGLIDKGFVLCEDEARRRQKDAVVMMATLSVEFIDHPEGFKLTPKQKKVVSLLETAVSASVKEISYHTGVTAAVVGNLRKSGVVSFFPEPASLLEDDSILRENLDELVFSPKQQEIFDGISALLHTGKPECALLRGVTGSGKTSIFIKLIESTLNAGKTAIMLVPEISLTPQMVRKFRALFGGDVALIHSSLSMGRRISEYNRIRNGQAKIVVGTRSAIFAPLDNIGIIVIDEEGEHTYKSEQSPRYHARDVAKQRAFRHNALLLLASATPSIESYYHAKTGRYHLFEITERYSNAILPDVYMVDMKIEAANGNNSNFSEVLLQEMQKNLDNGEQSILLLNRRGFHTYVSCMACGNVEECPNCGIPLTYHKANGFLSCHYCGYLTEYTGKCTKCQSKVLKQTGTGTQRIEDEIKEFFPTARVLRLDADTTMAKNAFDEKLGGFGEGEYDILVGTQMIAKGLDFPNVTLVGVLLIDKSLYASDYMGYENTFSLVTQVVGRSGRGEKPGRAYIQTFSPEHPVLNLAARQSFDDFYEDEIQIRKAMLFPPFCTICVIGFSSIDEPSCVAAAEEFNVIFKRNFAEHGKDLPIRILGPAKNAVAKINGRFRYRIILKCKNNRIMREIISNSLIEAQKSKQSARVSIFADMNGEIN